jgi:hypothetical protein
MPGKRFVDIEACLRWAYRDELPKRQHGGRLAGGDVAGMSMFKAAVDEDRRNAREPGFPAALGDPHPDSDIIEKAVRNLAGFHRLGDDIVAGLGTGLAPLVTAIDLEEAAVEAVAALPGIVIHHARMGTRPRWRSDQPAPYAVHGSNGQPKVLIDEVFVETIDRKGRVRHVEASKLAPEEWPEIPIVHIRTVASPATRAGLYREGTYHPLVYRPSPAGLLRERAEYTAWRAALELLSENLAGKLASIAPLPPAAPWRPWLGESDAHGRPPQLFAGLRETPYRRPETREQAAEKRRTAQRRSRDGRAEEVRPTTAPAKGGRGVRGPGAA